MLSSYAVPANEGCSGTSGTKTLTLAAAGGFANNDLILIHQTRGTGAGNWQLNAIVSGATTTTLTLKYDLTNTYTDSGASQAQVIELNQYEDLTTGSITAPSWDGSKGGIIAFLDKGTCTVSGAVTASLKGFRGSATYTGSVDRGYSGEGSANAQLNQRTANGNGGGGGGYGTGGGGGFGTAGSAGEGGSGSPGAGGSATGNVSLTSMMFGGAGGQSIANTNSIAAGGDGGGAIIIFASDLVVTGTMVTKGAIGSQTGAHYGSGSGAGGSILLKAQTATLGTVKITAPLTAGFNGTYRDGGAGGVGRIHLDYSDSYTGTTTPTIDVTLDTTIKAGGPNFFAFFQFL